MENISEGNAIIYCQDAFNTPSGKTAHGLVRFSQRYKILCVIDSNYTGQDSGMVLDKKENKIPIVANLHDALLVARDQKKTATHFLIGFTPEGGKLNQRAKEMVKAALKNKLNIDNGLHDFLSEDEEIKYLADRFDVRIKDIRKPPHKNGLHYFSGKIEEVKALKIVVLGTDSSIGKRTTAWILVNALNEIGYKTEMIGTGGTAWMQGAKFSVIIDSIVNNFVTGEIEHLIHMAWATKIPDIMVIEGQSSLLNPASPGGYEIIAAARPDIIILQHSPTRDEYDGYPGCKIHPLEKQIEILELISGKPVVAITINHENMTEPEITKAITGLAKKHKLPVFDVLLNGGKPLAKEVVKYLKTFSKKKTSKTIDNEK